MKDLFSRDSKQYAKFRPTYPDELYNFIFQYVNHKQHAWDVGTGNGQVARVLAKHFEQVYATDISQKQLEEAVQLPNIQYLCCNEYENSFAMHTLDLITVGQAFIGSILIYFIKKYRELLKKVQLLLYGVTTCFRFPPK